MPHIPKNHFFTFFWYFRQGFSVLLELVLELALVDHAGLKLTEIRLPLTPECWDSRPVPLPPGFTSLFMFCFS